MTENNSLANKDTSQENYRLPDHLTIEHAIKLSILEDKPIMTDYWVSSLSKKALIGVRTNADKLLVKSEEEYTSPIKKLYKIKTEYIVMTENSIYIVDSQIPSRKIS
jgi:hypothetical protein